MSTSDVREQETTELPRTPVAAVDVPPAEPAAPPEPNVALPADGEQPGTPGGSPSAVEAAPSPRSLRPSWMHVAALAGTLIAGYILYLLLITGPLQARSQSHLIDQFRTELRTQNQTALLTAPSEGAPVALISIPSLGVTQVAVQGISPSDTMLGPGRDPSSVLPGQAGNAVIVGRGTTYGAPFAHISDLQKDDVITAVTAQGQFTYRVTQAPTARKLGDPGVALQTKDSRLTMITAASSFRPSTEWVVTARLVGTTGFQSGRLPLPSASVEPGNSTGGSWGAILLWGELLLATIAVTWVLYRRRFAPAVTYLLTTPPLIALTYLLYGALATLLPPSL